MNLFNDGFDIQGSNCKLTLTQNICDKPARASLLGLAGHRSHHGCAFCLTEQQSAVMNNGKRKYFFPYQDAEFLKRDDAGFLSTAIYASENNSTTFGINGLTYMLNFPEFSPVFGSVIDQLHAVNGVGKKLLGLLLTKYPQIDAILNDKIDQLKPPNNISRRIRNLNEIKNFRAHEYRSFFLYYGLYILQGLISDADYENVKYFNKIIYNSNQEFINDNLVI